MGKKEDILRKVRGLLDTADSHESTGNPEAAQSYRNKADEMMTLYAIESFELEFAKPANERQQPELREYEYGHMPEEIRENMVRLFGDLAQHCRCKMGFYGWARSKVVGYPGDLDYLDLLFTSVRMHMSSQVRPEPGRDMGYEASLALLKESGLKWREVYPILVKLFPERFVSTVAHKNAIKARQEYESRTWNEGKPFAPGNPDYDRTILMVSDVEFMKEVPRPIGVRFTKEYTEFCKATGRERVYSDPKVWQRSFVEGYTARIRSRLYEMAKGSEAATVGKGLVLANRDSDLLEALWTFFPDKRPHPAECECDACHVRKCTNSKCTREACKQARKPIRYRSVPEQRISHAAMQRGANSANSADLSGRDRRVGGSTTKGISQ